MTTRICCSYVTSQDLCIALNRFPLCQYLGRRQVDTFEKVSFYGINHKDPRQSQTLQFQMALQIPAKQDILLNSTHRPNISQQGISSRGIWNRVDFCCELRWNLRYKMMLCCLHTRDRFDCSPIMPLIRFRLLRQCFSICSLSLAAPPCQTNQAKTNYTVSMPLCFLVPLPYFAHQRLPGCGSPCGCRRPPTAGPSGPPRRAQTPSRSLRPPPSGGLPAGPHKVKFVFRLIAPENLLVTL